MLPGKKKKSTVDITISFKATKKIQYYYLAKVKDIAII